MRLAAQRAWRGWRHGVLARQGAADLAGRLAELARRAAEKGEQDAISAQEIAALAARRVRGSPSDRSCV